MVSLRWFKSGPNDSIYLDLKIYKIAVFVNFDKTMLRVLK